MSFLKSLFFRRKRAPLACTMSLDPTHVHGDACFTEIRPLSIAELYQSQGCESCPPAIPLIHKQILNNHNVLLLTFNVTYFDTRSAWKDTFGNAAWNARQQAYIKKWGRDGVFTPQLIIDGSVDGVGRLEGEVTELLSKAIETRNNAALSVGVDKIGDAEVRVASEAVEAETHDVLLIVYDPKAQNVKVEKGPNKRKKMNHVNVVKDVVKIEEWSGGVRNVVVPLVGSEEWERVVVVQNGVGGGIVAACRV